MQIAARQRLFDYAVSEALDILGVAVEQVRIPEYKTKLEIPVIGGIDVAISNVNITDLQVPRDLAKVAIESGYYHLKAANLTAQITFDWAWSKGPLSGSGNGALSLAGGSLDEIFLVRNQESGVPQLVAVSSAVGFGSLDLSIHSYSADWLYQALLYVFSGVIQREIEEAVNNAMHTDVPAALNGLLDSLPSKVSIQGLPFDAVFTYALYTLNYVIVKGYGEVAVPPEPAPSAAAAAGSSSAAGPSTAAVSSDPLESPAASAAAMAAAAAPESDAAAVQAAVGLVGQSTGHGSTNSSSTGVGAGSSSGSTASLAAAVTDGSGLAVARRLLQYSQGSCPFPAGPLPLTPAEIGGDSSMFSAYLHEAIPNCIFWGLFKSGMLRTTVQDGNIPQLRLITDLFGGLIPELPKHYSKKGMLLQIDMLDAPTVAFNSGRDGGVVLSARYDTNVSVLNATGDGADLLVARLTANVSIAADFGWEQTVVHSTSVSYASLWEMFPVNVKGWNQIIDWVVKQAGPKQSLGQLWDTYVKTPATPYVALDKVSTKALEQWFVVSSDVKVLQLPPIPATL